MSDKKRQNLVIVRAGDSSLHPRWLEGATDRNWDLIVNYYGDDPEKFRTSDSLRIDGKGLKGEGLCALLLAHEQLIDGYEYVMLADDDLLFRSGDIDRLFDICASAGLDLAQPSLSHDSWVAHLITLHNPCFHLRYTSFVECMSPCMSREALRKLRPTFSESLSWWGIDYVWPSLLAGCRVAIIDDVQACHTRQVGSGKAYSNMKAQGVTAWDESREVMKKYGLSRPDVRVRAGITAFSSREITAGFVILLLCAIGELTALRRTKAGWRDFFYKWMISLWQQVRSKVPVTRSPS